MKLAILFSCIFGFFLAPHSQANTLTDLPYGEAKEQKLDVYLPAKSLNSPILFMVHGGAWRIGDKQNRSVVKPKVERWVKQGWVFVSINYRMLPKTDPYRQAGDVAKALAYVQAHSAEWGADPGKLVVMGHSAGAHLVSLVLTDAALYDAEAMKQIQGGILLDSAALDITKIMSEKHPRLYDRAFGKDPVYWRKTSAIEHLHSKVKPMLAVCSTQRDNSCAQASAFVRKARTLGVKARQLGVDLSHTQINANLGEDSHYTENIEEFIRSLDPRFKDFLAPATQ